MSFIKSYLVNLPLMVFFSEYLEDVLLDITYSNVSVLLGLNPFDIGNTLTLL